MMTAVIWLTPMNTKSKSPLRVGIAGLGAVGLEVARRLIDGEVRVIATGGGAFVDPRTRQLLNERAITIWLDAPVEILAERTGRRDTRPLLRNGDRKETLGRLSQQRQPSYAEAHIHVKSGNGAHREVVDSIIEALVAHLDEP